MTRFTRLAAVAVLAMAPATAAFADTITGSSSVGTAGTFNSTSITFMAPTAGRNGTVTSASGTMASFLFSGVLLNSFTFTDPTPINLFTATNGLSDTLSFVITSLPTHFIDAQGSLNLAGMGMFTETGPGVTYTPTSGIFSLTSTTTGTTSFTISSTALAATPEPSSLLLLGTGLVGAATTMVRRRRAMTA